MDKRKIIEAPVAAEFKRFNDDFTASISSSTLKLQSAIDKIMLSSGKHIRPLLLLLTAKACGGITEKTLNTSIIVELLHTASLVHDDVIDETKERRGVPSLNAFYDNRVSVLVGDYILSSALMRSIQTGDLNIMTIVCLVGRSLSEGELQQIELVDNIVLSEEDYYKVVKNKTARLISACAEIGALSANASEEIVEKCKLFGEYLGYCFQIKDDIFDYYEDAKIGKPTGNDILEGKVTLPLLHALMTTEREENVPYYEMIEKKNFTPENIKRLIDFAKSNGGIEYAQRAMEDYCEKAKGLLRDLPPSPARESLLLLADYIVERDN
ncbi:octaprenyl-diphosphate synthase [Parabacteroides sp. PF5-5]|uniref:polyprenyl synthetase family protein n=1 Tax=unclassified Parabacteroides TaxID=2649774 RepID=UPI0024732583|nr:MULTISPECIES: polyprenyl synthetase family protein [unclassified Parabacteroides]MDH6305982.1 octaprenyl-diphosphate synthase [Parabacteroides sp. PH5-39]MDH6317238.1 octaprenyl-diphosphate synthase [Parabacteroides sp. PF5-13]MDH6320694.1 octaprenyl-diphosphate synthase [Parabacteroides sp. PH5-13]MDH6324385.1 octaprenyl-diphosphate synthase [Parabacteroides sp. PH5-8]MDH6328423.1 octaprenyl-diphosphate synthase [Parabacteroides sp. PH5-41]